jgi:hypothetical protein
MPPTLHWEQTLNLTYILFSAGIWTSMCWMVVNSAKTQTDVSAFLFTVWATWSTSATRSYPSNSPFPLYCDLDVLRWLERTLSAYIGHALSICELCILCARITVPLPLSCPYPSYTEPAADPQFHRLHCTTPGACFGILFDCLSKIVWVAFQAKHSVCKTSTKVFPPPPPII